MNRRWFAFLVAFICILAQPNFATAKTSVSHRPKTWAVPELFNVLDRVGFEWTYKCRRIVDSVGVDGTDFETEKSGEFSCQIKEVKRFKQAIVSHVSCTGDSCGDGYDVDGFYVVTPRGLFLVPKRPANERALAAAVKMTNIILPPNPVEESKSIDESWDQKTEPTVVTIASHEPATTWCTTRTFLWGGGAEYTRCYSKDLGPTSVFESSDEEESDMWSKVQILTAKPPTPAIQESK